MKTFTQFNENMCNSVTADINPGNSSCCSTIGVMNHYTPVENIVTNVRNLFAPILGCVAAVGEDGVSVKLHSTKFVNKEEISRLLYQPVYNHVSLNDYIMQQGLDFVKMINLGQYWVVYFCPRDIPQADNSMCPCAACTEQLENETELYSLSSIYESDDDEEMEDETKKKFIELITSRDKVKSAKQLELLIAKEVELPREFYFSGVKASQTGEESIALRWKYTKKSSPKNTIEITKSIMNIYGTGDQAIFVADFVKGCYFQLPPEVKKLIENLLEMFGAEKTNDPSIFSLPDEKKKDEKTKENEESEDDSENEDTNSNEANEKEDEDDSRGGESDDLI